MKTSLRDVLRGGLVTGQERGEPDELSPSGTPEHGSEAGVRAPRLASAPGHADSQTGLLAWRAREPRPEDPNPSRLIRDASGPAGTSGCRCITEPVVCSYL